MRLQDKVVIVTGGANGIGRVYVRRLAAEGARVVVADIDGAGANEVAQAIGSPDGPSALPVVVDVSDKAAVQQMVKQTLDRFGRIDVLVNNAAMFTNLTLKPMEQIDVDEWDQVMAVNVRGVFLCCQAVIPHMRQQGKGKIINIASGTLLSGSPNFLHYVTSKGAVFALTRALSREVGAAGITVNTIAPGLVPHEAVRRTHDTGNIERQRQIRAIPRDETPEDLEGTLVFLASDDSDFMTGQMMVVNGGAQFW
jgi:NAD(P)-dependent dehydrogenase (short-subunit alcohol dehydrogenase family)